MYSAHRARSPPTARVEEGGGGGGGLSHSAGAKLVKTCAVATRVANPRARAAHEPGHYTRAMEADAYDVEAHYMLSNAEEAEGPSAEEWAMLDDESVGDPIDAPASVAEVLGESESSESSAPGEPVHSPTRRAPTLSHAYLLDHAAQIDAIDARERARALDEPVPVRSNALLMHTSEPLHKALVRAVVEDDPSMVDIVADANFTARLKHANTLRVSLGT